MAANLHVQVFRGGQLGATYSFDSAAQRTIKIGRLASAQVRLDDPKVARIHAVLEFTGTDLSLLDMSGAAEGTQVNGTKVHKVRLNHGDQVTVGETLLVVSMGDAPVAVTSTAATVSAANAFAPITPGPAVIEPGVVEPPPMRPSGALRFDPGVSMERPAVVRTSGQRLRAAAVENRPHPAIAPEPELTNENRLLELRLYWGEVLLGINHYHEPRRITIGETKKTNIFISSEGLPAEEFPLVRFQDGEYLFTFTKQMEGEVEQGGQASTLQEARASAAVKKDEDLVDSYRLPMAKDARAIVHWGGATFALRFVPPGMAVPKRSWKNLDFNYLNLLFASVFVHLATIVTFIVYPTDTESLREDLFSNPGRFANLILEAPKTTESNKNLLEKMKKQIEDKKEEIKEEEVKKKPEKQDKLKEVTIPAKVKPTQAQRSEEIKQKFSKLFTGSGAGSGSLLGGGGGGSLSGTLSNVIGTAGTGSASGGMAGLGIRGTGPLTGGGVGLSRGIAGIGTSGRAGGGGLGYGSGIGGLGLGKDRGVIDIGAPVVMGSLDPAVIKKVIDENKAQIRYCYEKELQRNQNLEGKIAMKWVIAATGAVATVKVRETTMNSPGVESCIAEKIKGWKFPQPAGGGIVEVNYPFIFKAS